MMTEKEIEKECKYCASIAFNIILLVFLIASMVKILRDGSELHALREYKENNIIANMEYNQVCPICGQKVELKRTTNNKWYIVCSEDIHNDGCGLHTGYYDDLEELITEWNKTGGNDDRKSIK